MIGREPLFSETNLKKPLCNKKNEALEKKAFNETYFPTESGDWWVVFHVSRFTLPLQIVGHREHLLGGLDRLGVDLISPLSDDHIDHLFDYVHV